MWARVRDNESTHRKRVSSLGQPAAAAAASKDRTAAALLALPTHPRFLSPADASGANGSAAVSALRNTESIQIGSVPYFF